MTVLCITLNPAIDLTMSVSNFCLGKVNRSNHDNIAIAGKGLNVARILHALGHQVVTTGFIGQDNISYFETLIASKDACFIDAFVRVAGNTRINVKITHDATTSDINGQGFVVSDTDKDKLFTQIDALIAKQDFAAVVVAGSLPQGFDQADFDRLLSKFDPARLAVDVTGRSLVVACAHKPWLIKPNDDELTEAFGLPAKDIDQQLTLIHHKGLDLANIVVSMGAQGALWYHKQTGSGLPLVIYRAVPPKVAVHSTVGAGDTMLAAMVHGLLTKALDIDSSSIDSPDIGNLDAKSFDVKSFDTRRQEVFGFATALSAYAVTITDVGVPDDAHMATLLADTQVQALHPPKPN